MNETIYWAIASGLTSGLLSVSILIMTENRKRKKQIRRMPVGSYCYALIAGELVYVLIVHNRPSQNLIVARYLNCLVDVHYEEIQLIIIKKL